MVSQQLRPLHPATSQRQLVERKKKLEENYLGNLCTPPPPTSFSEHGVAEWVQKLAAMSGTRESRWGVRQLFTVNVCFQLQLRSSILV